MVKKNEKPKHNQRKAEQLEKIKNYAIDSAYVAMGITDLDGNLVFANRALLQLGDFQEKEILGKHATLFFKDETDVKNAMLAVKTKGFWQGELTAKKKDGSTFNSMFLANLISAKNGNPLGMMATITDITKLKQVNEELYERERRFRILIENLMSGVALIDEEGKFVTVNSAFLKMFGLSKESDILRVNSQDWSAWQVYEEDGITPLNVDEHPVRKAALTGKPVRDKLVGVMLPTGGDLSWMLINAEPILKQDGSVQYLIATYYDITDRKKAQALIDKNEVLLRTVLENSLDGINMLDLETSRYVLMSPSQVKLTGFTAEEINNMSTEEAYERVHPNDREISVAQQKRVAAGEDLSEPVEYRWKVKSGEYRWFSDRRKLVRDTQGKPTALVGSSRDITERKEVEEALKQSEERFKAIASSTPDHIIVQDINLRYTFVVNPQLGLTEKDMLGKTDYDILTKEDADNLTELKRRVIKTGKLVHVETQATNRQGELEYFSGSYVPRFNEKGEVIGLIGYFQNFTDRKKIEKALRESEERFRTMTEISPVGIGVVGYENGEFLFVNPTYEKEFGYAPGELLNRRSPDVFFDNADRERIRNILRQNNNSADYEVRLKKKDGTAFWGKCLARPVKFDGKDALIGAFIDITERKKAEEALIESEARANALIKYAPTGIYEIDFRTGNFISINDAMSSLTGYTRKELFALGPAALLDDESKKLFADRMRRYLSGEKVDDTVAYVVKKKDGSHIFINLNVAFSKINPNIAFVIGHDVTERVKAEREIQTTLNRFYSVLAGMPLGVLLITPEGICEFANQTFCDMFKLKQPPSALIKLTARQIMENIQGAYLNPLEAFDRINDIVGTGQPVNDEEVLMSDGRTLLRDFVPISIGDSHFGRLWIHRDISERKKVETLKDEFIGMVSHELKTPVTVIMGAIYTAMSEGISRKEIRELLTDAVTSADSLSRIVDNLLDLSRNQANRLNIVKEPTDIAELVSKVVNKLKDRSNIHRIIVDIPSGLSLIETDRIRIERILHNLIENGIKYSPEGGDIVVFVRRENENLLIGVKDSGIGISVEDQSRLFTPFERLQTAGQVSGVGLGLNVCRILVEAHGGRIWVESQPGQGSTFFFTLPLH